VTVSRPWLLSLAILAACGGRDKAVSPDAAPIAAAPDAAPAKPRPIRLTELKVTAEGTPWDARVPRPTQEAAEQLVRNALHDAGAFESAAPDAIEARLTVEMGVAFDAPAGRENLATGLCSMRLRFKDGSDSRTWETAVAGQRPIAASERKTVGALGVELVAKAVGEAVNSLHSREAIRIGDEAAVLAGLDDQEDDVRREAFRAVGERKIAAAVPRLIELLATDERRDEALGALVELRDPRAVKPLIDTIEFKDLQQMAKILDAVGQIGGEEARAYLDFVASGHEVPEVRALAKAALERLERRQKPEKSN
jgi:hypothetical protein